MDTNKIVNAIHNVVDEARNRLSPYSYVIDEARTILEDAVKVDKCDVQLESYVESEVVQQLSSNQQILRNLGVKRAAVAQCQNHDVTGLWPGMAKNVMTSNADVKRFVHAYVLACYTSQPDVLSLSINSMYKDIISTSYLERAQGLRILCQLVIEDIALVDAATVISACGKGFTDTSPYVRKVAVEAATDLLLHQIDNGSVQCDMNLLDGLLTSLRDNESYICGAAARGLSKVMNAIHSCVGDCSDYEQNFIDKLHQLYRLLISSKIDSMPPLDAACAIETLVIYSRLAFKDPQRDLQQTPADLHSLFDYLVTLRFRREPAVVASAALGLVNLNAPTSYLIDMIPHLFRIMGAGEYTTNYGGNKAVMLEGILPIFEELCNIPCCKTNIEIEVRAFLPVSTDTLSIRSMKLQILRLIINNSSKELIIHAIVQSVHWKESVELKKLGFQSLYDIAIGNREYIRAVISCFTMMLHSYDKELVSLVSQTLCSLLGAVEKTRNVDVIRRLCTYFLTASSDRVSKKAKIDFISLISGVRGLYPYDAPKCVLDSCKTFKKEDPYVKMQMMAYAMEVLITFMAASKRKGQIPLIEDEMSDDVIDVVCRRLRSICMYMAMECLLGTNSSSPAELVKSVAKSIVYALTHKESEISESFKNIVRPEAATRLGKDLEVRRSVRTRIGLQENLPAFANEDADPSLRKAYIPPTTVNKSQVESSLSCTRQVLGIGGKMNTIPDFAFHGDLDEFLAAVPTESNKQTYISERTTDEHMENKRLEVEVCSDISDDETVKPIKINKI